VANNSVKRTKKKNNNLGLAKKNNNLGLAKKTTEKSMFFGGDDTEWQYWFKGTKEKPIHKKPL